MPVVACVSQCAILAYMPGHMCTAARPQAAVAHGVQVPADGSQMLEAMVLNMYVELIDGLFCQVCMPCLAGEASGHLELCNLCAMLSGEVESGRMLHTSCMHAVQCYRSNGAICNRHTVSCL